MRALPMVLAVSLFAGAATRGGAQSLSELERAASANAASVRLAQEDSLLAQSRLDQAEAMRGGRFIGGIGLADTREPVTDTLARDYRRANAQVGARWPLLEGAQAQERATTDARGALEAARLRARQVELEALRELRLAYVDHLRSGERLALAEALLRLEPSAAAVLTQRTRRALLLEADRREFESIFVLARRDVERARAQRDDARRRVRRLAALPQAEPRDEAPRWDLACVAAPTLMAGADARPMVALAALELATREALAGQQRWDGIDAGVSLTQSLTRDVGGLSGRSTGVGVDVTVPFGWRSLRDARRAESDAAVRRARLALDAARETDAAGADQVVRDLRVRAADRAAALQHLDAAQEALRVAESRAAKLDGDVLEKVIQARHAVYVAAIDVSDTLQRLERAQVDVLAYAAPCGGSGAAIEPAGWSAVPDALARPLASSRSSSSGLGWFVWQAGPWLADPATALATLPDTSQRVLLGLDAPQLQTLATPAGAQAARVLIDAAHARGVRIELLLGDPGWLAAPGRERLLALLRPLAELPFDGLTLDLERSQLAPAARRGWADGVVATAAAVRGVLRWPLALTTHDRDLRDAATNRRLRESGVGELIPLIYVSDAARAAQRVRAVIDAAPALRVSVGQSVERTLPPESSLHRRGRAAALTHVGELARALAPSNDANTRFDGVVIQSLEEFRALNAP